MAGSPSFARIYAPDCANSQMTQLATRELHLSGEIFHPGKECAMIGYVSEK